MKVCPSCNAECRNDSHYCYKCGFNFEDEEIDDFDDEDEEIDDFDDEDEEIDDFDDEDEEEESNVRIQKEPYSTVVEECVKSGFGAFENDYLWEMCGKSKPNESLMSTITSFFKSDKSKREDAHLAKDLFLIGAMVAIYTCEEYTEYWYVPKDYERITSFYNTVSKSIYLEKIRNTFYPEITSREAFLREFYRDLEIFRGDYKSAREKQLSYWSNNPVVKKGLEHVWTRTIFADAECFLGY